MRHVCFASLGFLLFCPGLAEAQVPAPNYELFRVDTTLSIPFAHGPGSWGFGAAVEPKFNLLDFVAVGLRAEGAVLLGGDFSRESDSLSVDFRGLAAFLAKVDVFFTTTSVRPFAGFGMGVYTIASQSISTGDPGTSVDQVAGTFFGIAPQLGVNFGPFRLAATYNVIVGADVTVRQTVTIGDPPRETSTVQHYFSFEIGGTFAGGRREARPVDTPPVDTRPVDDPEIEPKPPAPVM